MKKKVIITLLLTFALSISMLSTFTYAAQYEKNDYISFGDTTDAGKAAHEQYKNLVAAMTKLKATGVYTDTNIKDIHKFYENAMKKNPESVPKGEKELLDLLYKAKEITKTQYEQTRDLLK